LTEVILTPKWSEKCKDQGRFLTDRDFCFGSVSLIPQKAHCLTSACEGAPDAVLEIRQPLHLVVGCANFQKTWMLYTYQSLVVNQTWSGDVPAPRAFDLYLLTDGNFI
jgi:hypothetical protein